MSAQSNGRIDGSDAGPDRVEIDHFAHSPSTGEASAGDARITGGLVSSARDDCACVETDDSAIDRGQTYGNHGPGTSATPAGDNINGAASGNRDDSAAPAPVAELSRCRKILGVNKEGRDPRYLALRNFAASLTFVNIVGYLWLGFEQPWLWPFLSAATAYIVELVLETLAAWAYRRRPGYLGNGLRGLIIFLLPAHITGLTFNLLTYAADQFIPIMFGITVAVGTKWVLRAEINGKIKHFMNPSNFGIVVSLLVLPQLGPGPAYHFVENLSGAADWLVVLALLAAGTMINAKLTRKMPLILAWLGAFVLQAVVRGLFEPDINMIAALLPMTGIAFVLFTNYMITDPATSPFAKRDQVAFGASIGIAYGILTALHASYGLFFAVVIVCAVRGLYWWSRNLREWLSSRDAVAPQQEAVLVSEQARIPELASTPI